jgi:hypothetical protein
MIEMNKKHESEILKRPHVALFAHRSEDAGMQAYHAGCKNLERIRLIQDKV